MQRKFKEVYFLKDLREFINQSSLFFTFFADLSGASTFISLLNLPFIFGINGKMLVQTACSLTAHGNSTIMRKSAVHVKSFVCVDCYDLLKLVMHRVDQVKWEFYIFCLFFLLVLLVYILLFVAVVSKMTVALVVVNLTIFITCVQVLVMF
jgi:hypothetical protein